MFASFIRIVLFIYIIMNILEIRNIHIYNLNASLKIMKDDINRETIETEIHNLAPLLLKNMYTHGIDNEDLMKKFSGYMIQDMGKLLSLKELKDNYHIYENSKIVSDLEIDTESILKLFENKLTTNRRSSLSLYGGSIQSSLLKNVHNTCAFTCNSQFTFYLFNPKHSQEILGKDLQKIKKWAIKIELMKGDILYIPNEWNYIYKTDSSGNLLKTTCDNYFSVFYNFIRG